MGCGACFYFLFILNYILGGVLICELSMCRSREDSVEEHYHSISTADAVLETVMIIRQATQARCVRQDLKK